MSAFSTDVDQEALTWLVRVNDPAFEAWEDWDGWMAADASHAEAYWRLADAEAEAVEALRSAAVRTPRALATRRPTGFPRRGLIAAAVAVVALGGAWYGWSERARPWTIETAPGESRSITLADGSRVLLDGATRLTLDRRDPRDVTLEAGRALFEVTHDETDPFRVEVGDAVLTDLGTIFDVTRLSDGARVSVSEGQVRVDLGQASATLNPGDGVLATSAGLEPRAIPVEDVAGWRVGRLSYANESLAVVAQDLARALDTPIAVSPALANRRFSGSLTTRADRADQRLRLGRLLGVTVVEDGEGWRLEP